MDRLVPILNQLQSVLGILGGNSISLPQLVVVGSQSSGKSSVLENIVGRDFQPRGNNIVTRRPLVLQLYNTSFAGVGDTEWGEFEHVKDRKFYDFAEIKKEIITETERLLGRGANINSTPIYLRIHSPHVPTLTLVDQPGIVKVATGDQPEHIEKLTKQMITHFISNPNSVIVAVSSATEDIANSEALKIAKEVDPLGNRTLSVLTKLDLMDKGTDACRVLQNSVIPLLLGHCGVINRSQKDINENKSITSALEAEKQYIANSVYAGFSNVGTPFLSSRLSNLLLSSLQTHLPSIKQRILDTVAETERELKSYGNPQAMDDEQYQQMILEDGEDGSLGVPSKLHRSILLDIIRRFHYEFANALDGKGSEVFSAVSLNQLYGGARIAFVFNNTFSQKVDSLDPFDNLNDQDLRLALQNATGPRPALFMPEAAFEALLKRQIERLRGPALECVDLVLEELKRVATQVLGAGLPELARFQNLKDELTNTFKEELLKRRAPTISMVKNLVNIELSYINTNHPEFLGGSRALTQLAQSRKATKKEEEGRNHEHNGASAGNNTNHRDLLNEAATDKSLRATQSVLSAHGITNSHELNLSVTSPYGMHTSQAVKEAIQKPMSDRENVEIEVLKLLIASYFSIVKKTIKDVVPKTIMFLLVNKTKTDIYNELVSKLFKEDKFEYLFTEAKDIGEKRDSCTKLLSIMRKALEVVNRVKEAQA